MDYNDLYGLGIAVFIILLILYYLLKKSGGSDPLNKQSQSSPSAKKEAPPSERTPRTNHPGDQRSSQEDEPTADHPSSPRTEPRESARDDERTTPGNKDFSPTQALLEKFQEKLNGYKHELIPALEKSNKLFLEKIKRKLASDAGYFDEGDVDFDTSSYSSLLSSINQEENGILGLIEEFNKNPVWKGTEYEAVIKRALLSYEEAFAKRKSLTDAFNEAMKTMMS